MDMNISGSGQIAAGEYDRIRISGSGQLAAAVKCNSLHVSGAASGSELVCVNEIHVSGSSQFSGKVTAGSIAVSGGFTGNGDIVAKERISASGSIRCGGTMKSKLVSISGKGSVTGDVEAETVKVKGKLDCAGLLNAEEIEIEFKEGMEIGSIGGSKIVIYKRSEGKKRVRLPLFSSLVKAADGTVRVKASVEGDDIALEGVITPRVSGRVVAIGAGCEIDLVQYSEKVEISPEAKVGRTEQIRN